MFGAVILKPRVQGDIGELSAMEWLAGQGAHIYVPLGHSPDIDLIAELEGALIRVEVKTATHQRDERWGVLISTRGGNQSWSGLVKYFDPARCDYLFVHVGDGRRWFIPTDHLECTSGLTLGGTKYSEFEVSRGRPLAPVHLATRSHLESGVPPGVYPSGQRTAPVKRQAHAFAGSNPAAPIDRKRRVDRPSFERAAARSGQTILGAKRRLGIPMRPFDEAGLSIGDRMRVRADGPGRVILERIELPGRLAP